MTMPFGMYLRYYFRCGWKKTLLLSFLLSLFSSSRSSRASTSYTPAVTACLTWTTSS